MQNSHVKGIAELPPLPQLSYAKYDAAGESNDSSDWGCADGQPTISLANGVLLKAMCQMDGAAQH
jgi:hypothetical protein